ncbi:hypothetical protein RJ498_002102 [Pluralibacter gergoviae]
MLFFICKVLKKLSYILKSEYLSCLYKKFFLLLLEKKLGIGGKEFYDKYNSLNCETRSNKIWVYWGQGFDNAPPVVQNCLQKLLKNAPSSYETIVLDDSLLDDYITIPDIIQHHLDEGIISKTHFSDIVRFKLLEKYGGIWIDSTILVDSNFASILKKNKRFISLKHNNQNIYTSITEGKWTSYFIGAPKNSNLARFMSDAFVLYWERNNCLVDYVLVDYLIALAYYRIPAVNEMIEEDERLLGNSRWLLQDIYDKEISIKYDNVLKNDAVKIYKLSYKIEPPKNSSTYFYKYFLDSDIKIQDSSF